LAPNMLNALLWKRRILSNNMRLLLYPKKSALTTQLSVAIEYGSNSDPEDRSGAAHLVEHMLAGGSKERINRSQSIESIGGTIEYSTSYEDTIIITDIIPNRIAETARILSEQLFDSTFEESNFKTEQKTVLNEIAEASDDPWKTLEVTLRKNLFKNHPIRLPTLGLRRTVSGMSLAEVKEAHSTKYVPENLVLILTGKFSDAALETVLKDFSIPTREHAPSKIATCTEYGNHAHETTIQKKGISQTYFSIGARTVPANHPDAPTLDLVETLMGSGVSSRLFVTLRLKNPLAYTIDARHELGSDFGYFHIDCAIRENNLPKTQRFIKEAISGMRDERVSEDELKKCKNIIIADTLRTIDSSQDLPLTLADFERKFNNENALFDYVNLIQNVSTNDINEAARKYLGEERLSSVIIIPKTSS